MKTSIQKIEDKLKALYHRREEIAPDHDPNLERDITLTHRQLNLLQKMNDSKLIDDAPYTLPQTKSTRNGPYSL